MRFGPGQLSEQSCYVSRQRRLAEWAANLQGIRSSVWVILSLDVVLDIHEAILTQVSSFGMASWEKSICTLSTHSCYDKLWDWIHQAGLWRWRRTGLSLQLLHRRSLSVQIAIPIRVHFAITASYDKLERNSYLYFLPEFEYCNLFHQTAASEQILSIQKQKSIGMVETSKEF